MLGKYEEAARWREDGGSVATAAGGGRNFLG